MDDETIEVPLPEGVRPDPDTVVTQEIPVVAQTLAMPKAETRVVETLPVRLLGDPILTMPEPEPDDTPLYDQIHGPRPSRAKRRSRKGMQTADKVLLGMGATAAVGITFVYGMVAYGWGSDPVREASTPAPHRTVRVVTPTEEPVVRPTSHYVAPTPTRSIVVVSAPRTHVPIPVRSTPVAPSPTPTPSEATSAPQTPSRTPEPTESPQSPSATPSVSTTPSNTPDPASPSISLEP